MKKKHIMICAGVAAVVVIYFKFVKGGKAVPANEPIA
jgi:hypothetical protein